MGAGVQGGGDFQRVLTIRSPAVEVTFVKVSEQAESGSVEAMGRNEREGVCVRKQALFPHHLPSATHPAAV